MSIFSKDAEEDPLIKFVRRLKERGVRVEKILLDEMRKRGARVIAEKDENQFRLAVLEPILNVPMPENGETPKWEEAEENQKENPEEGARYWWAKGYTNQQGLRIAKFIKEKRKKGDFPTPTKSKIEEKFGFVPKKSVLAYINNFENKDLSIILEVLKNTSYHKIVEVKGNEE